MSVRLLSMGFSSQEYWSGLPFPSPGDLPDPRIEPQSPALQADSLPTKLPGKYNTGIVILQLLTIVLGFVEYSYISNTIH